MSSVPVPIIATILDASDITRAASAHGWRICRHLEAESCKQHSGGFSGFPSEHAGNTQRRTAREEIECPEMWAGPAKM